MKGAVNIHYKCNFKPTEEFYKLIEDLESNILPFSIENLGSPDQTKTFSSVKNVPAEMVYKILYLLSRDELTVLEGYTGTDPIQIWWVGEELYIAPN